MARPQRTVTVWRPIAFLACPLPEGHVEPEPEMAWSLTPYCPPATPIVIWPVDQVPSILQPYLEETHDLDWVALVPDRYPPSTIPWLQVPAFGSRRVREYPSPYGRLVAAYHA